MIRATKESMGLTTPKLDRRIRQACRTYCPDGVLTVGRAAFSQPNAARYSHFQPSNQALPAILVISSGDNIVDISLLQPDRSKPTDVAKKLKAELIRQHEKGEFRYWD